MIKGLKKYRLNKIQNYCLTSRNFLVILVALAVSLQLVSGQQKTNLDSGWFCKNIKEVQASGYQLTSDKGADLKSWLPAVVPGTVLTTHLENNKIPDPFYGFNNQNIEDIYDTGREHYTYWLYKEFDFDDLEKDEQLWLHFRGVNYGWT